MIEVHPEKDITVLKPLYEKYGVEMSEYSVAAVASSEGKILGCCLFELRPDDMLISFIDPIGDVMFADGLLRSALHIGIENGRISAFYSENAPDKLFKKLGFIKSAEKRELNTDKLFESCENCNN